MGDGASARRRAVVAFIDLDRASELVREHWVFQREANPVRHEQRGEERKQFPINRKKRKLRELLTPRIRFRKKAEGERPETE